MELDPHTTALLLIDVQNDYWAPPRLPRDPFVRAAQELLALAREAGILVVHVQHARVGEGKGGFRPGTEGFEVHESVSPLPDERRIVKHTPSSFYGTDLDDVLRAAGIETLLIAGMQTQKCCDTTTRDASARGYRCLFVADAVETFDLVGPDGEMVDRDEVARVTFAALQNGFAEVVRLDDLRAPLAASVAAAAG